METPFPQFRLLLVFLLTTSVLVVGCRDTTQTSPTQMAQSFLMDIRQSNHEEVMEAIWPETRQKLQQPYDELEAVLNKELPFAREELLIATRVESPMFIRRMELSEPLADELQYGDKAILNIEFRDDRTGQMILRWGEGRWYVDLPIEETEALDIPVYEDRRETAEPGTDDNAPAMPDDESNDSDDEINNDE